MRRFLTPTVAALAALALFACAPAAEQPAEPVEPAEPSGPSEPEIDETAVRAGIDATNARAMEVIASGEMSGLADVYTADATILPPDGEMVSGQAEIIAFWEQAAETLGLENATLETGSVEVVDPETAYEIGTATLTLAPAEGEPGVAEFKYVVIWKQADDGTWKWHVDIWNANPPPAGGM